MKKIPQAAAAIALGVACAMPVMAQDSSSTTTAVPDTETTQAMGAGPEYMASEQGDDRDLGWLGLLGLAGLLGLRRKHHDHHDGGLRTAHPTR